MKKITIVAEDSIAIELAKSCLSTPGISELSITEILKPETGIDLGVASPNVSFFGERAAKNHKERAERTEQKAKKQNKKFNWKPSETTKGLIIETIKEIPSPFKIKDILVSGYSRGTVEYIVRLLRAEGRIIESGGDRKTGFLYTLIS